MSSFRFVPFVLCATVLVACEAKKDVVAVLPSTPVVRQDIAVRVQATGTLEPINPVDIKSKANGQIIKMPVEIGNIVKPGDLLAQVDPRDVKNEFDQAMGDDLVSTAALKQAMLQRARDDSLFSRHVITQSEHDSTAATTAAAVSDMISSRASLDLARQNLEDATVRAPIEGTIVARPVTDGMLITSANSPNGGTTLMTVADLGRVRMRVTIDEVEMANVRVGESASVLVDAFPDRVFPGVIEKIEPQAVVTQSVTFFQALVNIDNKDGVLMPGMNGEVTIKAADLPKVLQVPIDAVRPTNQLAPISRMFDIPVDTLNGELRADLIGGEGTTGIPGRYAVVALPSGGYEMRLVKTGPTDLRVIQILDGLKEGDQVVMLGAIMMGRQGLAPRLQIAENMKRGAPSTRAADATPVEAAAAAAAARNSATAPPKAAAPTQPGKASKP